MERLELQHINSNSLMKYSTNSLCYLHSFASSVCETISELPGVEIQDDNSVIGHPELTVFQQVYRSDKEEYVLKCLDDNCMWHFKASRLGDTDLFKIRYIKNGHNCSMDYVMEDHRQATSSLFADSIKHKYMDAKTIYTLRDIINDASKTYGVTLSYGKVWREGP
ncbi:MuDRA-like transposase [Abeliophyllum distichum]|uniref:MuDRA-like transposase n=1 Tax=Abeliophyllum distichum TaxID=126358 RepID=A0ABD1SY63_9LAMI